MAGLVSGDGSQVGIVPALSLSVREGERPVGHVFLVVLRVQTRVFFMENNPTHVVGVFLVSVQVGWA